MTTTTVCKRRNRANVPEYTAAEGVKTVVITIEAVYDVNEPYDETLEATLDHLRCAGAAEVVGIQYIKESFAEATNILNRRNQLFLKTIRGD